MERSYSPQDVIQLPRLTAEESLTLTTELTTVAKSVPEDTLSEGVRETLAELIVSKDALLVELRDRDPADEETPAAQAADKELDWAWSNAEAWLSPWTKIKKDEVRRNAAQKLYGRLFSKGLVFVTKRFKEEWAESEARVKAIENDKLEATFELLGGTIYLTQIRDAHEVYGKALGITRVNDVVPESPRVGAARVALHDSLREYVTQVVALVRRNKPETKELSDTLLRPLTTWKGKAPAPSDEVTPGPAVLPMPAATAAGATASAVLPMPAAPAATAPAATAPAATAPAATAPAVLPMPAATAPAATAPAAAPPAASVVTKSKTDG